MPSYLCAPVRLRPGATIFLQLENMIRRHTGSTSDTLGTAASPWRAGIDTSDPAAGITVRNVSCRFIRYPSLPGGVDRPPGAHPHECPATGGGRSPRDSGQRFLPFHPASTISRGSRSPILRAPPRVPRGWGLRSPRDSTQRFLLFPPASAIARGSRSTPRGWGRRGQYTAFPSVSSGIRHCPGESIDHLAHTPVSAARLGEGKSPRQHAAFPPVSSGIRHCPGESIDPAPPWRTAAHTREVCQRQYTAYEGNTAYCREDFPSPSRTAPTGVRARGERGVD